MDPGDLQLRVHDVAGAIETIETRGAAKIAAATADAFETQAVESAAEIRARLETAQDVLGRVVVNRLRDGDTIVTHCHSTDTLACAEAVVDGGEGISAIVEATGPRKQGTSPPANCATASARDRLTRGESHARRVVAGNLCRPRQLGRDATGRRATRPRRRGLHRRPVPVRRRQRLERGGRAGGTRGQPAAPG